MRLNSVIYCCRKRRREGNSAASRRTFFFYVLIEGRLAGVRSGGQTDTVPITPCCPLSGEPSRGTGSDPTPSRTHTFITLMDESRACVTECDFRRVDIQRLSSAAADHADTRRWKIKLKCLAATHTSFYTKHIYFFCLTYTPPTLNKRRYDRAPETETRRPGGMRGFGIHPWGLGGGADLGEPSGVPRALSREPMVRLGR